MSTRTRKQLSVALLLFAGLFFALLITNYLLLITPAHALEVGVSEVDETIALSGTDIRVIIARIIRVALGLLGIIAVGLVLYGGFLWMTAAGDEDKVGQAKRVLSNAVIGLVIVLTSFAITQFVLSRLVAATTGGSSGTSQVDDDRGGLSPETFRVSRMRPTDPTPDFSGFCRNTAIRIQMSDNVDPETVPANGFTLPSPNLGLHYYVGPGDAPLVPTEATVSGNLITVRSTTPCVELPDERCFEPGRTYKFNFEAGLHPVGSTRSVNCTASNGLCGSTITIADCLDTKEPQVAIMVPSAGQSVPPDWVTIRGRASDDRVVSSVEFFDGRSTLGFGDITPAGTLTPVDAAIEWSAASLLELPGEDPGDRSCRILGATAYDGDDHSADATRVPVVVRPAHCFNGVQDADETGLDCGGDLENSAIDYCGRCAGEECVATEVCTNACRSGSCFNGTCVDLPRIDNFTRGAGPGSFITVSGEFFGTSGTVTFLGAAGTADDLTARVAVCDGAWTSTQIIVVVPEGVTPGPIAVTTAIGTDTTDNERGIVDNFSPDSPTLPGLCPVVPSEGGVGTPITLRGNGFGAAQLDSVVTVGESEARVVDPWGPEEIRTQVPPTPTGPRPISVTVSGQTSNAVMFTVLGPETGTLPFVSAVTPDNGPTGTYLTISGTNFGEVGQVIFRNPATGATALGDVEFPDQCEGVFWQQNEITVKVPETYSSGVGSDDSENIEQVRHELTVSRSGVNAAISNTVDFTVTSGTPAPGLCGILPVSGPENTLVRFFGEGFGTITTTAARFFEDQTASPTLVEREEFRARVPAGSQTGPVVATVATASDSSNPRNFAVADCRENQSACGAGLECCANGTCMPDGSCGEEISTGGYAWYISTGPVPRVPRLVFACGGVNVLPSPAPYSVRAGGEDVCVNAIITGRFSMPMDVGTINSGNIELRSCTGTPGELTCAPVAGTTLTPITWGSGSSGGHGFTLEPEALLPNTWYEVVLGTGIQGRESDGGIALAEDLACGPGLAYCWQFKTRETEELCALDDISIEPFEYTTTATGALGRVVYTGFGRTDDDVCIALDTRLYDFAWTATAPDGYATIAEGVPEGFSGFPPNSRDNQAVATPVSETPAGNPVDVRAVATADGGTLATGAAFLTIDYTDPEVVEWAPNCNTACINAGLRLRFNTDMSGAPLAYSVTNSNALELWQCPNESCLSPLTRVGLTDQALNTTAVLGIPPGHILTINPTENLKPNTYYRWVLRGSVQSRSGVSLVGENFGPDFSQIFRTKNDATACEVSSVELTPAEATVEVVGTRVPFNAIPHGSPDECSSAGQVLVAREYDWSWSVADANVAQYLVGGAPRDTNIELGPACSNQCLNTGAAGVFGRVAVCGNGSACLADVECATGEVCSRKQCIEAVLGEECDDGNTENADGCSEICLREGGARDPEAGAANLLPQSNDLPVLGDYLSGAGDPNPQSITSSTDAVSGAVSARIHSGTVQNSGGPYGGAVLDTPLAVQTMDTTYTLSYLAKKIGSAVTTIKLSHQDGDGLESSLTHRATLTGEWRRYSFTATLNVIKTRLYVWSDEPDRIWLMDDLRLVVASLSTPAGLVVTIPSPAGACGDGFVDYGEDCDGSAGCTATCLNGGALPSTLGGTTCGNGVVDVGEDCDDSNRVSRDGCSSSCLREGSRPGPLSICGNGDLEAGEECDGGAGCDRVTCLHTGTLACQPPFPSTDTAVCCGNGGNAQAGEDCDDGNLVNGDGCSAQCLYEGSSPFYAAPSFCGDGLPFGIGEECESGGGDNLIDPFQVAEAIGRGEVTNGAQSTTLTAGINNNAFRDDATFTLQCGFTSDTQCLNPVTRLSHPEGYGVGVDSCCHPRPVARAVRPLENQTGVCRNPLIEVAFPEAMDLGSFGGHVIIAREDDGEPCPAIPPGQEQLTPTLPPAPAGIPLSIAQGFLARLWNNVTAFIGNPIISALAAPPLPPQPAPPSEQPAGAGAWCAGTVAGRVSGVLHANDPDNLADDTSSLLFTLEGAALDAETWYRVRVVGDRVLGDNLVTGVRSTTGVGLARDYEFSFRTGTDRCLVTDVGVEDDSDAELFTRRNEEHPFRATAFSRQAGVLQAIVPVSGVYDWAWQDWSSSHSDIVTIPNRAPASDNPNTATVTAGGRNGSAVVSAELEIITDTLSPVADSTVGETVSGSQLVEVFLCENPGLEVSDTLGNGALPPPHGNFVTRYCRDAGAPGVDEDLAMMRVQTVPQPPGVVFKEFLLRYENTVASGNDAIGFRMLPNQYHFSAARWFISQGYSGSPQALLVDGYDAVRDDRTVYVNAANLNDTDGELYSNVYVISVNENASPETTAIFEQLISNLQFNRNLSSSVMTNTCGTRDGAAVSCSADLDCGVGETCQSAKEKIRRDTRRLADLRDIEAALASRCTPSGCTYPRLAGGTFVRSMSVSAWPSWLETFSAESGAIFPTDPLNRFADCPDDYDDATCFAAQPATGCADGTCYQCTVGSHVYEYTSTAPDEYRLNVDLEYTSAEWDTPLSAFSPGVTLRAARIPLLCQGTVVGDRNVCGDGIRGPLEECERGETSSMACDLPGPRDGQVRTICNDICEYVTAPGASCVAEFCGDGVLQTGESCDDGTNNGLYGFCNTTCSGSAAYCGDSSLAGTEECDLGATNGLWNLTSGTLAAPLSCAWDCSFPGPYCGDSDVNGREVCDGSTERGSGYCTNNSQKPCTTNTDCGGALCGGHCGERLRCTGGGSNAVGICVNKQVGEACNGGGGAGTCRRMEANGSGIAWLSNPTGVVRCSVNPANTTACRDLRMGAACTVSGEAGVCTAYPMERVRSCDGTGIDACARFETLGSCVVIGAGCGDGEVQYVDSNRNGARDVGELGEDCEDNNDENNDACTNSCRFNVCGDGFRYDGVEACDAGTANGLPCVAPYGGTCNYCSPTCTYVTQSGGFCGDGIIASDELCDESANPTVRTPAPPEYVAGTSLCNSSPLAGFDACMALCPPTYGESAVRFQNPSPSTSYIFAESGDMNQLAIPACRLGGNLTIDASFGSDVLYFPSPMDVLLVLDNSGSMTLSRLQGMKRALCGQNQPSCDALDPDGAIARLYNSRGAGDVRIGIVEFGGTSRFRTWNFGSQTNVDENNSGESPQECEPTDPVPCYDRTVYLAGTLPSSTAAGAPGVSATFASGFLSDDSGGANRNKLRAVIASFGAENEGTKAFLALKQAKTILGASGGRSRVVILMSDGVSTDCCSGVDPEGALSCNTGVERSHCSEVASCVGPAPECNVGFGQIQDLDCENISCADITEFQCDRGPDIGDACSGASDCRPLEGLYYTCLSRGVCAGGPREGEACGAAVDCGVQPPVPALCVESPTKCCATGSVACNATGGGLNDCQFSDPEAATMNVLGDGIYVFTVSFPNIIPPMERWADQDPTGNIDFSYAGNNALQMFEDILSNIGVRVQISNNDTFSEAGAANWVDEITIAEPDFGIPLLTPELNQRCTDTWQRVNIRTIYGGTGANATVTLRDPRWNYCPRVSF